MNQTWRQSLRVHPSAMPLEQNTGCHTHNLLLERPYGYRICLEAVSYTHLTLPTIYSV